MARVRIGEAARLAGVSKSTMHRMLKAGRISYETDERGERWIDQAEVARVFAGTVGTVQENASRHAETRVPETALERENSLLREMLERERELNRELTAERDRLLALLEQRAPLLLPDQRPWWRRWRA